MKNDEIETLADQHANEFKRFTKLEGIIIRGHIVVERQLIRAIEMSVEKPNEFDPERLTFSNKLMLAHMHGISDLFKVELKSLNKLRNQVAHSLQFDTKLLSLIIDEVNKKQPLIDSTKPIEVQIGTAISFICGAISQSNLKVKKELLKTITKEIMDKNNVA
jgi:hypothetical protein